MLICKWFVFLVLSSTLFYEAAELINCSAIPTTGFPDITRFFSSSVSDCGLSSPTQEQLPVKLTLKQLNRNPEPKQHLRDSTTKDLMRIQSLHKRTNQATPRGFHLPQSPPSRIPDQQLVATLASGFTLGSGEYFMDVFIGTPPKHFSLILDTGSDLSWIQCVPCHDCFEQDGPFYDPSQSSSYTNVSCSDPRCRLVSPPVHGEDCSGDRPCPYYYWYGDSSNTTGDFALETFTVNLTAVGGLSEIKTVENVMFGCGHWNRGLFHGAAGVLGLGRGPLSFTSQLRSLYGHSFSYCLVDRTSEANVSSKLIFGEDKGLLSHPELKFTSLVSGIEKTFYYVQVKSIMVGGEALDIPQDTWKLEREGGGGTIVDSGTTLSYFPEPVYKMIKAAFLEKVKGFDLLDDFPILDPCYNVSGAEKIDLPEFAIEFEDGAVWNFPVENYFIRLEEEDAVCLAILGTQSSLSIIGNYQQQNFHILYDTKQSRLGYAPVQCASI